MVPHTPLSFSIFRRLVVAACLVALVAVAPVTAVAAPDTTEQPAFSWQLLDSGVTSYLVGVDAVSADVAWAGGWEGQVLLTVDGGITFTDVSPRRTDGQFYDVEASSAENALVLAVGTGGASRVYRTTDGGATWKRTFRADPVAFFNCMAMFDRRHGFVMGDPIDGKFQVIVTNDNGRSWDLIPEAGIPDALLDEYGFTHTGSCAAATGRKGFFGTGSLGGDVARVFRSVDSGRTWEVSSTPHPGFIFGLDFRTNRLGLATGHGSTISTSDGGVTWELVEAPPLGDTRDVAWWSDLRGDERSAISEAQRTVFAVGGGSYVSLDRGKTWEQFDAKPFVGVDCAEGSPACWAVGFGGRIARLVVD